VRLSRLLAVIVLAAAAGCSGQLASPLPVTPTNSPAPLAKPPGPAPNYASAAAWMSLPPTKNSMRGVPSSGGFSDLESTAPVDVFYVYPTTAIEADNLPGSFGFSNATYDDPVADGLAYEIAANQAGTFNGGARIYAPYYRQAVMDIWFGQTPQQAESAAELAYQDARAAFEYYLAHYNNGRPIILVGHSQGAMVGLRLLKDEFDGKPLYRQLIAAYLPGQGVDVASLQSYAQVHPCTNATDLGCLNYWGSFQSGVATQSLLDFIGVSYYWAAGNTNYIAPSIPVSASMNPISWTATPITTPASQNTGPLDMLIPYPPLYSAEGIPYPMGPISTTRFSVQTYGPSGGGPLAIGTFVQPAPPPNEFDAYVPGIIPISEDFDGVWHLYDFNLYWTNIRQNARDRSNAFFLAQGSRVPYLSGPVTIAANAGAPLSYTVATTAAATGFSATGLNGLVINAATGTITGTPSVQTYTIVVTATNGSGTASGELALVAH
jgi:hypothetical protein